MNAPTVAWFLGHRSLGLCHARIPPSSTRFLCGAAAPTLAFKVDEKTHRKCTNCLARLHVASFVADLVADRVADAMKTTAKT